MTFLESTRKYNLNTIFMKLPYQYMLPEIAFIIACDKQYTKAFEICIRELQNVELSQSICDKVYKLIGDGSIYFSLFEVCYTNNFHGAAMDVLEKHVSRMPHSKVLKLFKGREKMGLGHYEAFKEIFDKVEKIKDYSSIYQRLTNYEVLKKKFNLCDYKSDGFALSKTTK